MQSGLHRLQLAAAVGLLLWPAAIARAGGFASARFGGEHSTAADALPSALYYNPAAITLLDGQQLMLDAVFALHWAEYTREADSIDPSTLEAVERAGLERDDALGALTGK